MSDAKRIRLTDRQCRIFLRDMIEFGYTDLTLSEVRRIADAVANGDDVSTDVVGIIMCRQIDEAFPRGQHDAV